VARFLMGAVGAVFGVMVGVVGGAAVGLHARDVETDVQEAAIAAGVDPVDLAGAANTVGVDPWVYARGEGLLEHASTSKKALPPPVLNSPAAPARGSLWDKLAGCESSGNWHASTGNGFLGGLQFTPGTWRAYGGVGSPAAATRAEQIVVAERVLAGQGWKAWPACSRALGLR
jgi:resuscitation-promoting factor RpfA